MQNMINTKNIQKTFDTSIFLDKKSSANLILNMQKQNQSSGKKINQMENKYS